jgi:uncharacterized membrane protein
MQKTLLAGLALLIPFVITLYFILWVIDIASIPFYNVSKQILNSDVVKNYISFEHNQMIENTIARLFAVVVLIIVSYILGLIAHSILNKFLIQKPLSIIKKIPFIGKLFSFTYKVSSKLTDAANPDFFKETVLFPFFSKDEQVLGIISQKKPPHFVPEELNLDTVLFIPTSPHPVSGFVVICSSKNLTHTKIHPEEALEFVIAMGAEEK